tara:strand:+ start:243 stop:425 length:183 start_codon:yes stop_codon:yes gene_type:complete
MPFSIIRKFDEDVKKNTEMPEECVKELQNLEKCGDKKDECTEFYNVWIKCVEKSKSERKD